MIGPAKSRAAAPGRATLLRNRALVRGWLYVVLLVMFALFMVGGATRLTDSGLSITEWQPIHGVIPPLDAAEWQEEFAKYQQIPEYRQINKDMTWPGSRRSSGGNGPTASWPAASAWSSPLPLLAFWLSGRLECELKPKLLGVLLLGGAARRSRLVDGRLRPRRAGRRQRNTGWRRTSLACLIFTATMVIARGLARTRPRRPTRRRAARRSRSWCWCSCRSISAA